MAGKKTAKPIYVPIAQRTLRRFGKRRSNEVPHQSAGGVEIDMGEFLKNLALLFGIGRALSGPAEICQNCKTLKGRFSPCVMRGKTCEFEKLAACRNCGSLHPCFNLNCELSNRIVALREGVTLQ
jgi:hypothetical protein